MSHRWEAQIERQRETPEKEWESQRARAEQRLLEAQEARQTSTQVPEQFPGDAEVIKKEIERLAPSEFHPEVEAEARLMRAEQEEHRLNMATDRVKQIEWLKPEVWGRLDEYGRRVALDQVGRELQEVYDHPNPPLIITERREDRNLQGAYRDNDYWIFMNKAAVADNREGKLFGNDPQEALRAYAHEWRHSYQFEQATRWNKPQFRHLVDDPAQAEWWSWNIRPENYKDPPSRELVKIDYERYQREYKAYRRQPVEEDANRFANELVKRVYGQA